jgi:hypothetical protein
MTNDEIQKFREQERASMIRGCANGYTAHWIDMHPHGKTYRTLDNASGLVALPEEQIMLLHRDGPVVMFLETTGDLDRIEKEMHLVRTVDYPYAQLPPLNRRRSER